MSVVASCLAHKHPGGNSSLTKTTPFRTSANQSDGVVHISQPTPPRFMQIASFERGRMVSGFFQTKQMMQYQEPTHDVGSPLLNKVCVSMIDCHHVGSLAFALDALEALLCSPLETPLLQASEQAADGKAVEPCERRNDTHTLTNMFVRVSCRKIIPSVQVVWQVRVQSLRSHASLAVVRRFRRLARMVC